MKAFAVGLLAAAALLLATGLQAATDEEIQNAIDDGLVWLAGKQNTTPGPDFGSWGGQRKVGKTAMAVKKFEHHAIMTGYATPFDPAYAYHEVVENGLNYIFKFAKIVNITPQPAGNPDSDLDGIGVAFQLESSPGSARTYETALALFAIAEGNSPGREVDVPGSAVDGWTYYNVAVDIVDWLAFAQVDGGATRGGWGYDANPMNADGSNSGFATLGLGTAQTPAPYGFGIPIPQFVKDEMGGAGLWIDYIQNNVGVGDPQYDGGSGVYNPEGNPPDVNILETGSLLLEMAIYGDGVATARTQDAIDYIVRAWNLPGVRPGDPWTLHQGWHGNYLAMFNMMKGFEAYGIDMIDGIDWFDEVSDSIVAGQLANGSWGVDFWDAWVGRDSVLTATWALLTLQKAAPEILIKVVVDIKPTSCPNPFNVKSKGVLPVAILGTEQFDVMDVDPASIRLEGVPPIRWALEDVATPVAPSPDTCACTTYGPDGYMDLTLKFDTEAIVAALGTVHDGEIRRLTLTGFTLDEMPIEGRDCIRILVKGNSSTPKLPIASWNGTGTAVSLELEGQTQVSVVVYDVAGRRVKSLVSASLGGGSHTFTWDGTDDGGRPVAGGVYFWNVVAGTTETTAKLVLVR